MLILLLVTTIVFDYSTASASQYEPSITATVSTDQSPSIKSGSFNLGEANTSGGYRIETSGAEVSLKDNKTESYKTIAIRNSFSVQTKKYSYSNLIRYDEATTGYNHPVFHQLLI